MQRTCRVCAPSLRYLYADLLLAFFLALSAVLLLRWYDERAGWQLIVTSTLMAAGLVTKRDALLFAVCLAVAAIAASPRLRTSWRPMCAVTIAAFALASPWWIRVAGGPSGPEPSTGITELAGDWGRLLASFELVGATLVDPGLWLGLTWLGALAICLAAASRNWAVAAFPLLFVALASLGLALVIAAEPLFEISRNPLENPVERLAVVPVLVLAAVLPLVLERIMATATGAPGTERRRGVVTNSADVVSRRAHLTLPQRGDAVVGDGSSTLARRRSRRVTQSTSITRSTVQ